MITTKIDTGNCTTIADLLRYRAMTSPTREALHFLPTGESDQQFSLSYDELDRAASAIAEALQSRYVPGSRCLLAYPAGFEFLKAFFGCLYADMVAVPVVPPERKQALTKFTAITQAAAPAVTLTTQNYIDKMLSFGDHAGIECIATDNIASLDTLGPAPLATPESLAFLQFTSGSTGQPKGVMIRHSNLWKNSIAINNAMHNSAESRVLSWLPAFHDMGLIGGLIQPLFSGADVTLMPPHAFLQKPLRWLQQISKRGITHSGGPSFAYEMCIAAATYEDIQHLDLSTWSVAFNGAEPVDARVLDTFSERFKPAGFSPRAYMPCYGLAENTLMVSATHKEHVPNILSVDREKLAAGTILASNAASSRRITSCGTSATEVNVRIVDIDTQIELRNGNVGEVWVSGSSLAAGYWALATTTAQTFGASLPGQEERYLRTGDLGFLHEEQLYITGRLKDLIIVRGLNYYPNDIEKTASASAPTLVAYGCAAFSVEATPNRLVIVQEVKRQALRRLDGAALCDQIRASVAAEEGLTLTDIVLVKPMTLPRTSSGKIQRHQCLQKFVSGETYGVVYHHNLYQPTQIAPNQITASNEVLTVKGVGDWLRHHIAKHTQQQYHEIDPERPFVEFGLDSVVLVELSALLAKHMEIDLPPELLFEYTTINTLQTALTNTQVITAQDVDFDAEMTLPLDVTLPSPYTGFCSPRKVLVTGATGFVAAYLLPELIRGGITELVCLVRCRDTCHGFERVRDNLAHYGHHIDNLARLLTIIPADPSQPKLGLNNETYEILSREIDTVLHCAGEPGWQKPYHALRDINVGATLEALKFSCAQRTKAFHHISTITIFEMKEGGCFENAIPDPRNSHGRGYNQSKAVADRLCLAAMERGLPVTIYRFPFAMGSAATGQMPMQITLPQLIKGIIETGLMPLENVAVNIVPVDYLAETIAALMLQAGSERRCFHIVNRKQLGMKDLAGLLTRFGYPYRRVPYDVWKTLVAEGRNACLLPLLPLLNAYNVSALVSDFLIDPTNTYTALHSHRPELLDSMPTSLECVSALIQYAQNIGDFYPGTEGMEGAHSRVDQQATRIDYPKLTINHSHKQNAVVMSRQVTGKQALAITQRTDRPKVFFRVLFADALRRWSQQSQLGLALATGRAAGMDSHFEWSSCKSRHSLLDGRPFDQHLYEADQTQRPLLWLQEEDGTQPVAFAYLECTNTEPQDKHFLRQFQHSLRDELERENSALACEVSSLDRGWEIQWRLTPSVDSEPLQNAFDYFMACINHQCDADWSKPMSFEIFLPFIKPSALANRTQTTYPCERSIHALFLEQAEQTPAAMAIRHCSGNLTYSELRAQVLSLADYINKQIPRGEHLVGLYCNRKPSALAAMLAVGLSGNAFVPLDPSYPENRLSMMLQQSRAPLVLADDDLIIPAITLAPEGIAVTSIEQILLSSKPLSSDYSPTQAQQLMYVMFTSGSTGRPKGVMIKQRSVVNFVHSVADTLGTKARGDWMAVSSFSFDISIMELFVPLTTGLCVVLASSEQARNAQQLHELINTTKPKVMHATPATWTMLLDAGFTNPQDMIVLSGADTLGEGLKNRLCSMGCSLWNFYGPTETTIYSAVKRIIPNEAVTIGTPLANTTLHVLDNDLQPAPVGVPGELYIGGDGLAHGFLHQPELTAERFVELSIANQPLARYFRTGDLAQLLPNGDIACMGRLDHQIKLRGYRIEIDEIESIIDTHEQVNTCAVVVQGTNEHRQLSAFIVPGANQRQKDEDLVLQGHRQIWDYTYTQPRDLHHEAGFWISSYNGEPIPELEMNSFFDTTAKSILGLAPRRVLEIGCGNGLLASRICPSLEHYTGLDFSSSALEQAREQLNATGIENASLLQGDAKQLSMINLDDYDLVILNSVVQYFPSYQYLQSVLNQLIEGAKNELAIFVGDVRDLARAEEFYVYSEFLRAPPGASLKSIWQRAQARVNRESELLLDAGFFAEFAHKSPQVAVTVRAHTDSLINEMTQFRYNVLMRVNYQTGRIDDAQQMPWQSMANVRQSLAVRDAEPLIISGIPDARRLPVQQVIDALSQVDDHAALSKPLRKTLMQCDGVKLTDLTMLAHDAGFIASYSHCGAQPGTVTAYLKANDDNRDWNQAPSSQTATPRQAMNQLANDPTNVARQTQLLDTLKQTLKRKLPHYMIPTQFKLVTELPLTANGKINRRALMEIKEPITERTIVNPQSKTERQILPIFQRVLGGTETGTENNFFELGGNSILATQLIQQVNEAMGTQIVLQPLFTGHNTVKKLAKLVEAALTFKGQNFPHIASNGDEFVSSHLSNQNLAKLEIEISEVYNKDY